MWKMALTASTRVTYTRIVISSPRSATNDDV